MIGRRLTCARRKEQSDGIAIATKSIASSSLPEGLCRRQKGETREEGGHALRGVRRKHLVLCCKTIKQNKNKKRTQMSPLFFDDFDVLIGFLDGFHKVKILLWSQVKFLFEGAEKVGVI